MRRCVCKTHLQEEEEEEEEEAALLQQHLLPAAAAAVRVRVCVCAKKPPPPLQLAVFFRTWTRGGRKECLDVGRKGEKEEEGVLPAKQTLSGLRSCCTYC